MDEGCEIIIFDIPQGVDENYLRVTLLKFNPVNFRFITNKKTQKRIVFVTLKSKGDVDTLIAMHKEIVLNENISCRYERSRGKPHKNRNDNFSPDIRFSNLPPGCTEEVMQSIFGSEEGVSRVFISKSKETGEYTNFGYIKCDSVQHRTKILEKYQNFMIDGVSVPLTPFDFKKNKSKNMYFDILIQNLDFSNKHELNELFVDTEGVLETFIDKRNCGVIRCASKEVRNRLLEEPNVIIGDKMVKLIPKKQNKYRDKMGKPQKKQYINNSSNEGNKTSEIAKKKMEIEKWKSEQNFH